MGGAGFAEMHLRIDDAGQHGEAGAVDGLARLGRREGADTGDAAVADADVAPADAVLIDDGAVPEKEIEGHVVGHSRAVRGNAG